MMDVAEHAEAAAAAYQRGDYSVAVEYYTHAIDLANDSELHLGTLYSNRSAARLRAADGSYAAAAHDAEIALSICPSDWRPRLRLAKSLFELGRTAEAQHEAQSLLRLSAVPAHAAQEAAALARRASTTVVPADASAASATSAITSAGRHMADKRQTLRVHLCPPLPAALRCGCWHTLSVRLTNEMGLFDAETFAWAASAWVRISAIALTPETGAVHLAIRQANGPPPPPEAPAVGLATDTPADGEPLLRLRRGRATAELRLHLPHSRLQTPPATASIVLRAELVLGESGGEAGGSSQSGSPSEMALRSSEMALGISAFEMALGAVSLPLPLQAVPPRPLAKPHADLPADLPAEIPAEILSGMTRLGSGGGKGGGGGGGGGEEPAANVALREALLPSVTTDSASGLHECVGAFRLLPPPFGAPSSLPVVLAESASGICGRVWDSGVLLARWLGVGMGRTSDGLDGSSDGHRRSDGHRPSDCSLGDLCGLQSRVVELGSGVGVAGLAAAALGARVLLTDLPEAITTLKINAAANAGRCEHRPAVGSLEWGGGDEALREVLATASAGWESATGTEPGNEGADGGIAIEASPPWLVMCSDVVYEPSAYTPLLETMRRLSALGLASRTLMAHRSRHPDEHLFFTAAHESFTIRLLEGPPFTPLGSPAGTAPLLPPSSQDSSARLGSMAHAVVSSDLVHDHGAEVRILQFDARDDPAANQSWPSPTRSCRS